MSSPGSQQDLPTVTPMTRVERTDCPHLLGRFALLTTYAVAALVLVFGPLLVFQKLLRWTPLSRTARRLHFRTTVVLAALALLATTVLQSARPVPFYATTNLRNWAIEHGYMVDRDEVQPLDLEDSRLAYPREPIVRAAGARNWNIVWLVCESLRADAPNAEVMPETLALATQARDHPHHQSGGNGTRMGIFSMFYSLYGAYWFPVLGERRSPVLIDRLQAAGHEITARTSAKFSHPEFDSTVWVNIPGDQLHEEDPELAGWQNDRQHVTDLLADLDSADPEQPFLPFLFFGSAHARYDFPPESIIRHDYLKDVNYAALDLEQDAGRLHARAAAAGHPRRRARSRAEPHQSRGRRAHAHGLAGGGEPNPGLCLGPRSAGARPARLVPGG